MTKPRVSLSRNPNPELLIPFVLPRPNSPNRTARLGHVASHLLDCSRPTDDAMVNLRFSLPENLKAISCNRSRDTTEAGGKLAAGMLFRLLYRAQGGRNHR